MTLERSILRGPLKHTPQAAMYESISELFPDFKKRMPESVRAEVVRELKKLVGDENVSDSPAVCASYGAWPFIAPEIVVRPKEVEHVQATLRLANKHIIPVTPVAGGCVLSAASAFCIPRGIVLDTSGMNKIIEINANDGYVVFEPGVTNGQLYKALDPLGYFHVKGSYNPQLSVFGPTTTQVNAPPRGRADFDDILGFEVVLPDGTLVRTGGACVKEGSWAHRYFSFPDIHGLWLNANGMLGVVTKVALRIYPKGEVATFHAIAFNSTDNAIKFCQEACLHGLAEHMIIWPWQSYLLMEHWGKMIYGKVYDQDIFLYDIWSNRNYYDPPDGMPMWLTTICFMGFKEVVDAQKEGCDKIAKKNGGRIYSHDELKRLLPYFYEYCVERFVRLEPPRGPMPFNLMIPWIIAAYIGLAPPGKLAKLEKDLADLFENKEGLSLIPAYMHPFDQGRMMFHRFYIVRFGATLEELKEDFKKYGTYSAELVRKYGFFGHKPPVIREESKAILQQTGGYYEVLKRIKKALDPNNIMSPHIWPGE